MQGRVVEPAPIVVLPLDLLVLLDTVLQVVLQVLLDHCQCVFLPVPICCFVLFLEKFPFDLSYFLLLRQDIVSCEPLVDVVELHLLLVNWDVDSVDVILRPHPLSELLD